MKVSIITVCYNREKFIKSTIDSVLNQNYENIEYIVVDGESKDSTMDIVRSNEPYFKGRMKWISEPDNGIYDAMNKGIKMATGDVVALLNSDDIYQNEKIISNVVYDFQRRGSDAVYGDLVYVNQNNTNKIIRYWKSGRYKKKSFKYGWMPPHPAFFVKKAVYDKFGLYNLNLKVAADYEFMLRTIYKGGIKITYLPCVLVKMRLGGVSNASLLNRLLANKEDRKAWRMNNLKPYFFTTWLKPIRKIPQYLNLRKNHA
jgi:glycosyltransferase